MSGASDRGAREQKIAACRAALAALRARRDAGEIDADAFDREQRALAAQLAEAMPAPTARRRVPVLALALGAVLIVIGLVWRTQRLSGPTPASAPAEVAGAASAGSAPSARALTDDQLQRMVDQATAQVQKSPKDVASWAMLAHTLDMQGKFVESSKAYASLLRLTPNDAQLLADYADALAVANGRTLAGEPMELVHKALALDPKNVKALALTGTDAFEHKDYAAAIKSWQTARDLAIQPGFRAELDKSIAAARVEAGGASAPAGGSVVPVARAALPASVAFVAGRVSLADSLRAQAKPDATVFIFARPAQGSHMPVALLRRKVSDLPLDFRLDDSNAMVAGVTLSQQASVVIGARVSQRGDVAPQPGDMQGWSAPVSPGTSGIKLEIGEVLK